MHGDGEPAARDYADRRAAERRLYRRALGPALALSVLLHLLVFRVSIEPDPVPMVPLPPLIVDIERVMRAYDITPVTVDVPPIDVQVRELEQRREVEVADAPWAIPPAVHAPPPAAASVRERLRYRMGSVAVWRPPVERQGELMTPEEVVRARVAAQLRQFNDSIAEIEAARARALDWSVSGGDGRRWGIAPGRIYAGTATVQLPFAMEFGAPPGRREEERARIRDWRELQSQAARIETQEVIDARIRAIRERAEQERARTRGAGGTSAPPGGATNSPVPGTRPPS
jgi:hypothetical protein